MRLNYPLWKSSRVGHTICMLLLYTIGTRARQRRSASFWHLSISLRGLHWGFELGMMALQDWTGATHAAILHSSGLVSKFLLFLILFFSLLFFPFLYPIFGIFFPILCCNTSISILVLLFLGLLCFFSFMRH
ncbi:hypothetical protein K432DRAFT_122839 [Lepidopterella palustris CBS 459.81]|uniref:Uncharacterized protein n=1 Tax=Lepidopterella palustris CBS 459.81 TaxID=1314670 RepID=A0A8E2E4Q6_9PEZI|nr:hypothetical protein K432DRAFT_122839 [Lepidopterella palustris CBS 459.81]